jgi:hypothetical protein
MSRKPDLKDLQKDLHLYHGEAVAASGYLTLPVDEAMPMQAAVSLGLGGGHTKHQVEDFSHHGVFSFKRAHSEVSGGSSSKKNSYNTLAQSVIEGLNIHNMVTCDRIVSRIAVHHPKDGSPPSIIPFGSMFENLRIGGYKVEPELAIDWFTEHDTWEKFQEYRPKVEPQLTKMTIQASKPDGTRAVSNEVVACTLVRKWGTLPPSVEEHGHGLWVPEFGMVYLAEFFVSKNWRRVRMIRTVLGCGSEGEMEAGGASGGGAGWP